MLDTPNSLRQHDRFPAALAEPVGVFVEGFEAVVVDQGLRLRDVLGGDQRIEFVGGRRKEVLHSLVLPSQDAKRVIIDNLFRECGGNQTEERQHDRPTVLDAEVRVERSD